MKKADTLQRYHFLGKNMFKAAITQFDGFRVFFWLNQFFFGNPTVFDGFRPMVFLLICRKYKFSCAKCLHQVFHMPHILNICDQNKISKNNGKLCVLYI